MQIFVYLQDPGEQSALCSMLQTWMELSCVSMEIAAAPSKAGLQAPAIIFWDLDSPTPPPQVGHGSGCALFLCSRDPQRAIHSYSFHPTGFLTKPVTMDMLWSAMFRCTFLWFDSLLRLEILSDRMRVNIPLKNLIWAEGTRRGCMVHTSHQAIGVREPLYQLEQRLPEGVFTRCQRSFVVNLAYVQEISGNNLLLTDGTSISLGRGNKPGVIEAYRRFCLLRHGE